MKTLQVKNSILSPDVLSKINAFDLRAKYIVEGFMVGLHKSPYHGFSAEFSQHRQYNQGDSIKDIDWKVYGRTQKYFIKQYEEETNLRSYLLLDSSNSMSFKASGNVSKFEYAKMLTASLSYLMTKQQDAVALGIYSEKLDVFLPPRSTNAHNNEIWKVLQQFKPSGKTETSSVLTEVVEKVNRRGLVIVISDFFDEIDKTLNSLKKLRAKNNEVILFQIIDPSEISFNFGSDAIFKDIEGNEEIQTTPVQIKEEYKALVDKFLLDFKSQCAKLSVDYNLITTNTPFDKALLSYFKKRQIMK